MTNLITNPSGLTDEQITILKVRLARTEGRRNRPYIDTVGKVTIGIGHNLTDKGISDVILDAIFLEDITEAAKDVSTLPFYLNLDPIRQTVVIDMVFNMGLASFSEFTNTIGYIKRGDYTGAADQMLLSKWAKQVGSRAVELATIMRTGSIQGLDSQ